MTTPTDPPSPRISPRTLAIATFLVGVAAFAGIAVLGSLTPWLALLVAFTVAAELWGRPRGAPMRAVMAWLPAALGFALPVLAMMIRDYLTLSGTDAGLGLSVGLAMLAAFLPAFAIVVLVLLWIARKVRGPGAG